MRTGKEVVGGFLARFGGQRNGGANSGFAVLVRGLNQASEVVRGNLGIGYLGWRGGQQLSIIEHQGNVADLHCCWMFWLDREVRAK